MCVELTMDISIISLSRLSNPVKILSASVSMKVVGQDNPVSGDFEDQRGGGQIVLKNRYLVIKVHLKNLCINRKLL